MISVNRFRNKLKCEEFKWNKCNSRRQTLQYAQIQIKRLVTRVDLRVMDSRELAVSKTKGFVSRECIEFNLHFESCPIQFHMQFGCIISAAHTLEPNMKAV